MARFIKIFGHNHEIRVKENNQDKSCLDSSSGPDSL